VTDHVTIGTAGHVDHGKTALVRALTGIDTDRWEEEKRRGITIDLGFAPLDLGEGLSASVVDVPGHEDFVRNMVAGATGIDLALLVIAADEGIMPQTEEHLAILEFLGVRAGVVAIAKTDLVDQEWLELVQSDVQSRVGKSVVSWEAIVPLSTVSGEGVELVREEIRRIASQGTARRAHDLFRMPVDRVFSISGTGTVVTGTTWSGSVSTGDDVRLLPGDHRARVRGIEVHGKEQKRSEPARRTALALAGLDRSSAPRGSCVVADDTWRETNALDVEVTLLPGAAPLTQRTRLRLHIGTAEVLARVTPAEGNLGSGGRGIVRLRLESPVVSRWGDRGVLRSYSPITTIGGCVVLDPWPVARPRRPRGAHRLAGDVESRVAALVEIAGKRGLPVADLPVRLGVPPDEIEAVLQGVQERGVLEVQDRLIARSLIESARTAIVRALEECHRTDPLAPGMPLEAVRRIAGSGPLAAAAERAVVADGTAAIEGAFARLASHRPMLPASLAGMAQDMRNTLQAAGFEGCTGAELAERVSVNPEQATRVVEFFVREGTALRVGRDRYYDRDSLGQMIRLVGEEIGRSNEVGPAQIREKLGLPRRLLIPFLEWMDGQGYTTRVGDVRRAGPRLDKGFH